MAVQEDQPMYVPSNLMVREFLAQYEDVAKETMKRRRSETYRDIAKKHLVPTFGSLKLKEALHINYKPLQETVVCSEPNYHFLYRTPNFCAKPLKDLTREYV